MGKKSKAARAKAKAGAASSAPSVQGSGGGTSGGTGAMVASSSSKRQKCVLCFRTVRPDKGSACPGCSQLYCWRCEKKEFDDCPNVRVDGTECARPIRRCVSCIGSSTMVKFLEEKEGENYCDGVSFKRFQQREMIGVGRFKEHIEQDEMIGIDAIPLLNCTGPGCNPDCDEPECYHCYVDPTPRRLVSCTNVAECCNIFCVSCRTTDHTNLLAILKEDEDYGIHLIRCGESLKLGLSPSPDSMRVLMELNKRIVGGSMLGCSTCPMYSCIRCMDDRSLTATVMAQVRSVCLGEEDACRQCSTCYWSTKPCTNPTCPNEVGVPTKRCGGCHIDRYCSVECQLAAYPAHMKRCQKIQEKRAAVAAQVEEAMAHRLVQLKLQEMLVMSSELSLSPAEKKRVEDLAVTASKALNHMRGMEGVADDTEYFEQRGGLAAAASTSYCIWKLQQQSESGKQPEPDRARGS